MSRIFKQGFLAAYEKFADDGFTPTLFHTWSALSIVAGALERKVWIPWGPTYVFYPNIFVLLVTDPGTGKSVASGRAVDILKAMSRKTGNVNILPNQMTEAEFIALLGTGRSFTDKSTGKEITTFQNAGYYYASEASADLRNIFGDFIACLTSLYDCPSTFKRATKKDGITEIKNACMNLLACTTFDYLNEIVSDKNMQGGFASRLIYVCHRHSRVQEQEFGGGLSDTDRGDVRKYAEALAADLAQINLITGPMYAEAAFGAAWKAWYKESEEARLGNPSSKIKSLWARTNTNLLKLSMILSACESDDRVLRLSHFEQARDLITAANAGMPNIFRESRAMASNKGSDALKHALITVLQSMPGLTDEQLKAQVTMLGFHRRYELDSMVKAMRTAGILADGALSPAGIELRIVGNPDDYL